MNAIIFDTETTGTPKNYKAPMNDLDNWPRITQLAWQKVNILTGEVIREYQSLITPDGWHIPTVDELKENGSKNPYFFEENGMSTEKCEAYGTPIKLVLNNMITDMNDSDILVAHNLAFDSPVCGAEMIRANIKASKILRKICTMETTTEVCRLPGGFRGQFKWPKLIELHQYLFDADFDGAHDALFDVRACTACFLELIKRKIIVI